MTEQKVIKLNLGAGNFPLEGYTNVDIRPMDGKTNLVCDILKGLPSEINSVDEIRCAEFLEHFTPNQIEKVIQEVYRVLKAGGVFKFGLPNVEYCAFELAKIYQEERENDDGEHQIEYLIRNIVGERLREDKVISQNEFNARRHSILFSEHYLRLLLEKYNFKNIEFGQHMEEYDEWKEKYKIIGRATKC